MSVDIKNTYLWLNILGIANSEVEIIESYFTDIRDVYKINTIPKELKSLIKPNTVKKLQNPKNLEIDSVLKKLKKLNINYYTHYDEEFPHSLKTIENSPRLIYVRGELPPLDNVFIGVVGSRKHTEYGKWACKYFLEELVKLNVVIVSGMAYGIDAIAHEIALKNNGQTVAVLGNGVDIVYPINNSKIYMNTINSGAVISEYPLGAPSLPYRFPERNRIISGLSRAVIVIEAREKSGSLITARVAAEQGREVYAVPGNVNSIYSRGTNKLIRDGAIPLLDIDDILLNIAELKITSEIEEPLSLNFEELQIYNEIENGTGSSGLISEKLNMNISKVTSILTALELKGYIDNISADEFIINK